ncbi:nitroreductase family protein [Methylosinus trichosporium]|uniref:NADPH-dependent oxidoreductase n=2 Tax=Methylosinus TaxID=425 RepID=A0A2D2D6B6_METT3|nr:nitroreductase family protein [Methylosinus trichosporium]ATQ70526.1 NADPH-dependent oxidoreductase [Methylosinus trichosporium OB3b]OBS53047.1 NADPH-dependent oxidoreductase [Methylosinus sp. 3S-1]
MNKPVTQRELGANEGAAAIRARYRRDDSPTPPVWNETLDLLLAHRSVRAYLPESVPASVVETMVAAAQSASTSSNLQVWSVVAVEDEVRKSRLADLAGNQQHIRDAPLFLLWLADLSRLDNIGKDQGRDAAALPFLEMFLTAAVDAALAAQNGLVALESLGYGGVYIGGIRNKPEEVAAELDLPPGTFAVFGMAVGRPDPAKAGGVRPRLGQGAVLHREQYAWNDAQREAVATYDEKFRDFQKECGLPEQGWIRQALSRVRGPESLSGRDRLSEVLRKLGFGLK